MSATTMEPTVTEVVVVRPTVPDIVEDSYNRIQNGAQKAGRKVKVGYRKTRRGFGRAWRWVKTKSKKGGRKLARAAQVAGAAVSRTAKRFTSWVRPVAASAWDGTARAMAWVWTPFRLVGGTALGWATLLYFGGAAVAIAGIGYLGYSTTKLHPVRRMRRLTGGKKPKKHSKKNKAKKNAKKNAKLNGTVDGQVDQATARLLIEQAEIEYPDFMTGILRQRKAVLEGLAAKQVGSVKQVSNTEGRLHLINSRLARSTKSAAQLHSEFRTAYEARAAEDGVEVKMDWSQFNIGLRAEDAAMRKLSKDTMDNQGKLVGNPQHLADGPEHTAN